MGIVWPVAQISNQSSAYEEERILKITGCASFDHEQGTDPARDSDFFCKNHFSSHTALQWSSSDHAFEHCYTMSVTGQFPSRAVTPMAF